MIVGGRVPRQLAYDRSRVSVDRLEPAVAERSTAGVGKERRFVPAEQLPSDAPIDQSNAELERATPVRTAPRRALLDPRIDVRANCVRVGSLARQCIRLRECGKVQVAIRLPQVFDVADEALIAIIERASRQ